MPREPLREEQVLRRPIDIRDRRVPERVEGVEAIEARLDLKLAEEDLDSTLREPSSGLGAEQRRGGFEPFALRLLVAPKSHELGLETVGQEHVARATALGDLGAEVDSNPRFAAGQVDIADVEADDLRQAESGAEGEGDEKYFSRAITCRLEQRQLVGSG
jgi:hypothetical protein